jgi:hypothetical protein
MVSKYFFVCDSLWEAQLPLSSHLRGDFYGITTIASVSLPAEDHTGTERI